MALKKEQTETGKKTQVFIVDDHPVVRDGLVTIINHEQDFNACGQAEDTTSALKAITELKPDVVVVDISLKNSDGIELTKSIKAGYPGLPVIIFSVHDESVYAERALRAGAQGYMMKETIAENIIKAIRTVLNGEIFVSDKILKKLLHEIAGNKTGTDKMPIDNLSDRELEIFRMIGEGLKASEAAKQLHLSIKTVETYRTRIKEKLGLVNASELLQYSIRWAKSQDKE